MPDKSIEWLIDQGAKWTQASLAKGLWRNRNPEWMLAEGCPVGSKELVSRALVYSVSHLDWAVSFPLELDTNTIAQEAIREGEIRTLDWLVQRSELAKADVDVSLCRFPLYREDMAKWKME
ncbi:hypothetical protein ml_115 [Mollivirus sibericum]|uniref:hypothetical protein n=1 Tax=Mollivirus sibericum TaxID=1678078 RepID=UPI0006B2E2CF|nr:hypothetical protein ml_115 [Mollivirus sibericum]ALD61917.1 hypothetical protein ml_115 [Mollivirus sibericum]